MRHIPVTEIVKIPGNGGPLKKDMTFSSMLNPTRNSAPLLTSLPCIRSKPNLVWENTVI